MSPWNLLVVETFEIVALMLFRQISMDPESNHSLELIKCANNFQNETITCESIGTNPKSRVAFVGPHSPLAQSGRGTITVWSSSQHILNLQTDLNFIGSLELKMKLLYTRSLLVKKIILCGSEGSMKEQKKSKIFRSWEFIDDSLQRLHITLYYLPNQIFLRCYCIRKYIKKKYARTWSVNPKCYNIANNWLHYKSL